MVEPTESFAKWELDRFVEVCKGIAHILLERPYLLKTTPHFTPVRRVDEVYANKHICLGEVITKLPDIPPNRLSPKELAQMSIPEIIQAMERAADS